MKYSTYHQQLIDEVATHEVAARLARAVKHEKAPEVKQDLVIYLQGELGVGKTTLVRGFLRALGFREKVKSPSYTLVESYECGDMLVFHFDLYRLATAEELIHLGIRDYCGSAATLFIEWPEHGDKLLPMPDILCSMVAAEAGREISMQACSAKGEAVLQSLNQS